MKAERDATPIALADSRSSTTHGADLAVPERARAGGVVVGKCFIDGIEVPHAHEHSAAPPQFLMAPAHSMSQHVGENSTAEPAPRRAVMDLDGLRVSYRAS